MIRANAVQPAVIGSTLLERDRLATGDSSRAVLRIRSSWNARVDEKTLVEVTQKGISAIDPEMLSVAHGRTFIYSREGKGEWRILTPAGAGTGEGTQLLVQVFPDGRTFLQVIEGQLAFENPLGRITLIGGEAGEATPTSAPRPTAVIETRQLLQWALYYPAVLEPAELGLTATERQAVRASLDAYAEGDLPAALEKYPASAAPASDAGKLYRAAVLLATGQVDESRQLAAETDAHHPARRALERMLAAVLTTGAGPPRQTTTASEALAESYYQQSRRQLDIARAAALDATRRAPKSGFAWTRLAELEFSFGRIRAAQDALEKALMFTPRNAQAHALRGYLLSAENRIAAAREAFERAIQLDGALGNAWLGLGLTKIKQGDLSAGRLDLQTAATVEPTRAFFYSYHAKALSAGNNAELAAKELALAKHLDPADPTPWLYSAIEHQQQNRYNAGVDALQQSLRLNDNRRLYRSEFLLDQDRAVRSSNLAQIFQRTGMTDLAVREATHAVNSDYTNPSAHLFLANSFDALREPTRISLRHETAWLNELLLASMLAPVGGGPLSQFISQQEYSKLLESDGLGFSSVGEWRSDGQREVQASVFGTHGRFSFGLDFDYFERSASRTLDATIRREAFAQIKYQPGARDVVYSLVKWLRQDTDGAINATTTARDTSALRYDERQRPGLLLAGWNRHWAPGTHTLVLGGWLRAEEAFGADWQRHLFLWRDPRILVAGFLVPEPGGNFVYADPVLRNASSPPVSSNPDGSRVVSPEFERAITPFLGRGAVIEAGFDLLRPRVRREFSVYTGELQQLWQTERNTLIVGARLQSGNFDADSRLDVFAPENAVFFASPASHEQISIGFQRQSVYAYDFLRVTPRLTLIAGASWDRLKWPENFRLAPFSTRQSRTSRVNAKAGVTFAPHPALRLQGVYLESLGGVSFDESVRLEPVQLAGFVQAFRTVINDAVSGPVEAPVYKLGAFSVDATLPSRTWVRAAFSRIDERVRRLRGAFDVLEAPIFAEEIAAFPSSVRERLAYREDDFSAGVNQLIGRELAAGAGYRRTRSTLEQRFPEIPQSAGDLGDQRAAERLERLTFHANWNSPRGWFARAEVTGYWQRAESFRVARKIGGGPSIDFWRFDAQVGRRFNRNQREVGAGVLNLTDDHSLLRPLTALRELPDERTFFVRYRVNF